EKDYEKSREQAELALAEGKDDASVAQLALGQALISLGRVQDGLKALNIFLQTHPKDPIKPQVQALVDKIQGGKSPDNTYTGNVSSDLVLDASRVSLPVSTWGPPGVDEVKPSVAAGVTCPADDVIAKSGQQIKELVDHVSRFAATEDL